MTDSEQTTDIELRNGSVRRTDSALRIEKERRTNDDSLRNYACSLRSDREPSKTDSAPRNTPLLNANVSDNKHWSASRRNNADGLRRRRHAPIASPRRRDVYRPSTNRLSWTDSRRRVQRLRLRKPVRPPSGPPRAVTGPRAREGRLVVLRKRPRRLRGMERVTRARPSDSNSRRCVFWIGVYCT
jgi:hypothetical protein